MNKIKPLAFYLPQYHPIPENDAWWGKGFTEWTNVGKAKPLFKGHSQPLLPGDLGYYDLRVPEVREQQAAIAKAYGVHGFIYYHYWFGERKQLLERVANEVLSSAKPDFPFCFCWANETWTGVWHGLSNKVLVEQKYDLTQDLLDHFNYLLPFFNDPRYIKVDGKPLFMIYDCSDHIIELPEYMKLLSNLAIENGFEGIYFMSANRTPDGNTFSERGFDSKVSFGFNTLFEGNRNKVLNSFLNRVRRKLGFKMPLLRFDYGRFFKDLKYSESDVPTYPIVVPNWDNTARSGRNGLILENSTPELFEHQVRDAISYLERKNFKESFLFIKSWNEWAEGNYLEPDRTNGYGYLEVIKKYMNK